MRETQVPYITDRDAARLVRIVEDLLRQSNVLEYGVEALHDTLDEARIVPSPDIRPDVVTMNSEVMIEDAAGMLRTITLVYPRQADAAVGHISVLSPLGNAVLGTRIGERVTVGTPAGDRVVKVVGLRFQPEAAGRYDL